MHFTLKNLGRLQEATIDLSKDLILLTGPNNTSKTYVAHAIYGFSRKCSGLLDPYVQRALPEGRDGWHGAISLNLVQILQEHILPNLAVIMAGYRGELADVLSSDDAFCERAEVAITMEDFEKSLAAERLLEMSWSSGYEDPNGGGRSSTSRKLAVRSCRSAPGSFYPRPPTRFAGSLPRRSGMM